MERISLLEIKVDKNIVRFVYSVSENLRKYFTSDAFFVEYEQDVSDVPISILTIPFVCCMAGLSWLSGAMLFVDEVDYTFYESFKQLKVAYSELHDTSLKGVFVPSNLVNNTVEQSQDSLLLFGGGIDCHTSLLRHKDKITGIINIYGWLESETQNSVVDVFDKKTTLDVGKRFGIYSYHVRSNFASQFNLNEIDRNLCRELGTSYWYGFLHSMAFLSISTPIAWTNKMPNLIIASSFTKNRSDVHCGSFFTTDSEYRFGTNGNTLHDAFELNRQKKVQLIVQHQKLLRKPYYIQACSFNDHNCCECEKCFRTVIELVAENSDPRDFGFIINDSLLDHWKSIIYRDVALWGVNKEKYYYHIARKRMLENYDNLQDKEFVDWFLNFDFGKAKKEGLRRYYRQNFFSILKRKLHL